jgi:serine phosphatase RsbU (regulator of sigma subunit)
MDSPKQKIISILLLSCFFILIHNSPLLSRIIIDKSLEEMVIGQEIEYLQDRKGRLRIEDVTGAACQKMWQKSAKKTLGFGFTDSVYWVRFTVKNATGGDLKFLFGQNYPLIDHMKIFIPGNKGTFSSIEVGDHHPFSERPYKNRKLIIPLELRADAEATYYVRQETSSSMNFVLSVWSPGFFRDDAMKEYQFLLFYYGIMAVMIVYNLCLFFFIRRIEYLHYALFVLFFLLFIMAQNGTAFQLLWPDYPWWANFIIPISLCLLVLFALLFTNAFLKLKENNPLQHKIIIFGLMSFIFIVTALCLFLSYRYAMVLSAAMTAAAVCYGIFIGILMFIKKVRSAYFYVVSWLLFLFGANLYLMMTFGVLPANFLTVWSLQIGSVLQVVLLSIALADRINTMRTDLFALTTHLEDKVRERTKELHSAMEELEAMNEQLVITKDALWGEMQLAKKIQTVLLPQKPAIQGYAISAYMATATEVGGDYYDIINAQGMDWVVIGDVSGHGVSAGIIMMMVQTSVQVVLEREPTISPAELLTLVNTTISKNMHKLNEDKYMTITVLAAHKDGKFIFSGLHQNIIIYRSATERIEVVDADGTWIGIIDDIHGLLKDDSIELHSGDILLLYTDGITEAWRKESVRNMRDPFRDMFGEGRLTDVLSRCGKKSPDEIRDAILMELNDYQCNDDVTMVVLKRL